MNSFVGWGWGEDAFLWNNNLLIKLFRFMERIFVYKTLKSKEVDYKALGHPLYKSEKIQDAILPDYKDVNKGSGFHTIVKDIGSKVKGKVLNLTSKDLAKLDKWEDKYRRVKVTLADGSEAWAYQLKVHKIVQAYVKSFS